MAQRKYLEEGGDDLEDPTDILELMMQLDKKFRLKKEFADQEKQSSNNNNTNKSKSGQLSGNGKNNNQKKSGNPCRKHDSAHEWKDCPDNKSNHGKSKGDKDSAKDNKKSKGDLHSTQSSAAPAKKLTPVVGRCRHLVR